MARSTNTSPPLGVGCHHDPDPFGNGSSLPGIFRYSTEKKESEISMKNGFMKSYKILRSQDDSGDWNMLILREYESFASLEKNEEKADEMLRQSTGIDDQKAMQGYMDRSKVRDVVGTKFMRN